MRLNAYHYLFANCYYWSQKINGDSRDHVFFGAAMVCQILLVNLFSLGFFLEIIGFEVSGFFNTDWLFMLTVVVASLLIFELNHKYFSSNKKYLKILTNYPFSGNYRFIFYYVIGSLVFMAVSAYAAFKYKWW